MTLALPNNFELKVRDNGSIDLLVNNIRIKGFGFACWSKNWSNFTHQIRWSGGAVSRIKNGYIVNGKFTYLGKIIEYRTIVLLHNRRIAYIEANLRIPSSIYLEGLVWGSWSLKFSQFANTSILVYRMINVDEIVLPWRKLGSHIIYSYRGKDYIVAVVIPCLKIILVPINVASFSVEDERFWGGNSYSIRFWLGTRLKGPLNANIKVLILKYDTAMYELIIKSLRTLAASRYNRTLINLVCKGEFKKVIQLGESMWKISVNRTLPWLSVKDSYIVDSEGYYIILRGANYMGMEFGWFKHSEEDFKRMASWGFNVVRIPIGWAYIEPKPGVINEDYLRLIDRIIAWAKKYGLYVVLDMHQWRWSKKYGGCGMPDWVVPDAKDYLEASVKFFTNKTLWEKFARVWRLLAERYKNESAIAAYDLFNEPMPKDELIPRSDFLKCVEEFYKYVVSEIRKVDKKHILMYMPIWGGNLGYTPFIKGNNIVLTIHYYVGGTWDGKTGYEKVKFEDLMNAVKFAVRLAEKRGVPLWIGEFGVGSAAYKAHEWTRDVIRCFDEYALGYAWWTYWRDKDKFGLLYPNGKEKEHILIVLDRPYVKRATAKILKMEFDLRTKKFKAVFYTKGLKELRAEIYIPERHYSNFPKSCIINVSDGVLEFKFNRSTKTLYITVKNIKVEKLIFNITFRGEVPKVVKKKVTEANLKMLSLITAIPLAVLAVIFYLVWYKKLRKVARLRGKN